MQVCEQSACRAGGQQQLGMCPPGCPPLLGCPPASRSQGADCAAAGSLRDRAAAGHLPQVCLLEWGLCCCCYITAAAAYATPLVCTSHLLLHPSWAADSDRRPSHPPTSFCSLPRPQHGRPGQVRLAHPAGSDRLWLAAAAAQGGAAAAGLAPAGLRPPGVLRGVAGVGVKHLH